LLAFLARKGEKIQNGSRVNASYAGSGADGATLYQVLQNAHSFLFSQDHVTEWPRLYLYKRLSALWAAITLLAFPVLPKLFSWHLAGLAVHFMSSHQQHKNIKLSKHYQEKSSRKQKFFCAAGVPVRDDSGTYRWKDGVTSGGIPYKIGVKEKLMPPIPRHLLDCSFYLYPSVKSAEDGAESGGSGFLVHVQSKHEGFVHLYALTNKHVVDAGCRFLRLNRHDGKLDVISSEPDAWTPHPEGDDITVMHVGPMDGKFKWFSVGTEKFISQEILDDYSIGPGDEAFLIGRLVTAAGRQRNTPVVRFGNISMMADSTEPVMLKTGQREAFLVECRSLSGFSGSPVFVHTTQVYRKERIPKELLPKPMPPSRPGVTVFLETAIGTFGPWLLGIDCAHVPLWRPVYESDRETRTQEGYQVEANTGIACVIPAWRILGLINDKDLVKARKSADAEIAKGKANSAILDSEL
jgi:hypothetical protein